MRCMRVPSAECGDHRGDSNRQGHSEFAHASAVLSDLGSRAASASRRTVGRKAVIPRDASEIVERIRAMAADESVPVKERLDSVKQICDAASEQEDKLTLSLDALED
jgi:hypothetical protein